MPLLQITDNYITTIRKRKGLSLSFFINTILVMTKIFIGSDHGGFELKQTIIDYLKESFENYEVEDLGPEKSDSVDYPLFGAKVGESVIASEGSLGIVICGSGIGISIAANKIKGIRAALCNSTELAKLAREHNGANVLAMGERTMFTDDPEKIVETFLNTNVDMNERHVKRRGLLDDMCS